MTEDAGTGDLIAGRRLQLGIEVAARAFPHCRPLESTCEQRGAEYFLTLLPHWSLAAAKPSDDCRFEQRTLAASDRLRKHC